MFKNYSPALFFSMAAIAVFIISPIVCFFFPVFVVQTFLYDATKVVLYPNGINIWLVLVAFVIFAAALGLVGWKRSKVTFGVLVTTFVCSIAMIYLSTLSHTMINKEQVTVQKFFDIQTVEWVDITEVVYEYVVGGFGEYTFISEGEQVVIPETSQFSSNEKISLYSLARQYNISFIEREKTGNDL